MELVYLGLLNAESYIVVRLGVFSSVSFFALELHVGGGLPLFVPADGGRCLVLLWRCVCLGFGHYMCGVVWGGGQGG